jgi:MFS family permease
MVAYNKGAAASPPSAEKSDGERGIYKWYVLGILVLVNIMGAVDRAVISVIAEPLKAEFHLSDKQIGLLGGAAYSLAYGVAVLPMGWLVDRVSRRALLSLTVAIWSALTTVCSFSTNFMTMFIARMGVGAGEAPTAPASFSLIADIFPMKQRNTAVSLWVAGAGGGAIVIFFVGAWLLAHFGWRTVFLVAGGPGLLLAALLYFTVQEPQRGACDAGQATGGPAAVKPAARTTDVIRSILGNAALCYAILAITLGAGIIYSLTAWTTSFLVRVHGMTVSEGAAWTGMGFGLCMTLGSLLVGPFADRFSQGDLRKLAIIPATTTFVAVVAGTVMALAHSLTVSLAGLAVLGLMCGFFLAPTYSIVLSLADHNERGTTLAATKLISILVGSSLIPLMTGAISDSIGGTNSIRPAVLSTVAILLLCTLCHVMIRRILAQREAHPVVEIG